MPFKPNYVPKGLIKMYALTDDAIDIGASIDMYEGATHDEKVAILRRKWEENPGDLSLVKFKDGQRPSIFHFNPLTSDDMMVLNDVSLSGTRSGVNFDRRYNRIERINAFRLAVESATNVFPAGSEFRDFARNPPPDDPTIGSTDKLIEMLPLDAQAHLGDLLLTIIREGSSRQGK